MRVTKKITKIYSLCLSVILSYGYTYKDGFHIFSICGNDTLLCLKTENVWYFTWKPKKDFVYGNNFDL